MALPPETTSPPPGVYHEPDSSSPQSGHSSQAGAKRSMTRTQKVLFFATGWLIVLMPFLFWWNTWFGRPLSDQQLNEYLHDDKKPRHIQHALVQMGDRMSKGDATVKQWYPELLRLATDPVEEVRNTDAWVMGQDTSGARFHETLLKMLADPRRDVRRSPLCCSPPLSPRQRMAVLLTPIVPAQPSVKAD
jgi:hypothetical protein